MKKQLLLTTFLTALACYVMAQDPTLEAYIPFNGSATITVGKTLDDGNVFVTNYGATYTTDRNGNPNSALLLDGTTYVNYGNSPNFQFGWDDFSVMLWMKGDPTQVGQGIIVGKRAFEDQIERAYMLAWTASSQELMAYYRDDESVANTWPTSSVAANEWHHVAMVFDRQAQELRVYVDAILVSTESLAGIFTFNANGQLSGELQVGRSSTNGQHFKGSVDDLYIFRKALTQAEIVAYTDCSTLAAPTAADQTFCQFNNPVVNDLQAAGSGTISWYDDAQSTTELAVNAPLSSGTYYVRQLENGCTSSAAEVQVTVNVTPAPTAVDQNFCSSNNPTVTDLVASGIGTIGWFDLNQGFDPLAPSTPLQTGTYSVVQIVDNCPSVFVEVDVTIAPVGPAPTVLGFGFVQFCEVATITELSTQVSGVGPLSWFDSELSTTPLNETDELATGFYYVSQTVNGCESERESIEVEIIPNPGAPIVSDQSFCNSESATVADLNTNGQNVLWYLGSTSGSWLPDNTALVDGTTYYAQLNQLCGLDRTPVQVSFPSVDNSVTIENGTITANQQNATYEWYFCIDGVTSIGVTDASFSPTDPFGAYAVVVTYQGCSATSNCIASSVVVGMDEIEANSVSAYPNPTSGILNLGHPASGQVLDLSGRSLFTFSNARSIDLSSLASGSYVVRTTEGAVMRVVRE